VTNFPTNSTDIDVGGCCAGACTCETLNLTPTQKLYPSALEPSPNTNTATPHKYNDNDNNRVENLTNTNIPLSFQL